MLASQVPPVSRLGANDNHAFRGSITLPEGSTTNIVFLQMRNGFLVQELAFNLTLKDFRIEYYDSGMPKSFESDIVIEDPATGEKISKTIEVNHPLLYKDFAIYQASFDDGGSIMDLQLWLLDNSPRPRSENFKLLVGGNKEITTAQPETLFCLSFFIE